VKPFKLKPEVKAKWLAALRSGKYKQGSGILAKTSVSSGKTNYCCLGVLAKVSGVTKGLNEEFLTEGMSRKIGCTIPKHVQQTLASLNDGEDTAEDDAVEKYLASVGSKMSYSKPHKFGTIANFIEKYL
jgi:hypothetical protein